MLLMVSRVWMHLNSSLLPCGFLDCILDFILVRSEKPHERSDIQYKLQSQW